MQLQVGGQAGLRAQDEGAGHWWVGGQCNAGWWLATQSKQGRNARTKASSALLKGILNCNCSHLNPHPKEQPSLRVDRQAYIHTTQPCSHTTPSLMPHAVMPHHLQSRTRPLPLGTRLRGAGGAAHARRGKSTCPQTVRQYRPAGWRQGQGAWVEAWEEAGAKLLVAGIEHMPWNCVYCSQVFFYTGRRCGT